MFMAIDHVEFHATSNFTFLEGASHPEEYVTQAGNLGYRAIGIADRVSLAGIVRAHRTAKEEGKTRLLVGSELVTNDGTILLAYPSNRKGYGQLSQLITAARRKALKGQFSLDRSMLSMIAEDVQVILVGWAHGRDQLAGLMQWGKAHWGKNFHLAIGPTGLGHDHARMAHDAGCGREHGVGLVASNHCLMHAAERQPMADLLQAMREHKSLAELGAKRQRHGQSHLQEPHEREHCFAAYRDALIHAANLAQSITFDLSELHYHYPDPSGSLTRTPQEELAARTHDALAKRQHHNKRMEAMVAHELEVIAALDFAPYFLTVHDIVCFARQRNILCQGRGSAANSVVCYLLGITAVDPEKVDLLFERFVSPERNEPPDIDVDFEHERREEVIQHIYDHYGRDHAALAATVIHFRARRAIRDAGRAMGFSEDITSRLAAQSWGFRSTWRGREALMEAGLDPDDPHMARFLAMVAQLVGFPRHLSQHVGGFVITHDRLDSLVPVENAAMEDRTVIQWDKDDLDHLGMLKIDVLSLGMLSCIHRAFNLLQEYYGLSHSLANLPPEDPAVYEMLGRGDSLGVFQVESRAQMAFLPRMKPKNFYDLVIEVAIVRPGPIQGDMVHPYLRRRNGEEEITYASRELQDILGKTLGVPLFQEQAMRIAVVAAGFTPGEADQLRRAMATFRKVGTISYFRDRMIQGMIARGYQGSFAERCFRQIEGFGEYGFPESHAASFALIVYASAWIKAHYPDIFCAALLNAQPLGFYAPAQIITDAQRHGVEVHPVCVNASQWEATLEPCPEGKYHAVRLGFAMVKGFSQGDAERLVMARGNGYGQLFDLRQRAGLSRKAIDLLAAADAFAMLGTTRRDARWEALGLPNNHLPLLDQLDQAEASPAPLPPASPSEEMMADYRQTGLSLRAHPMTFLREMIPHHEHSGHMSKGLSERRLTTMGLALTRQKPGTASGIIFVTLEDEHGVVNVVVRPAIFAKYPMAVVHGRLLEITGKLERRDGVIHLLAEQVHDRSGWLDALDHPMAGEIRQEIKARAWHPRDQFRHLFPSRDFH